MMPLTARQVQILVPVASGVIGLVLTVLRDLLGVLAAVAGVSFFAGAAVMALFSARLGAPTTRLKTVRTYFPSKNHMVWRVEMSRTTRREEPLPQVTGPLCKRDRTPLSVVAG